MPFNLPIVDGPKPVRASLRKQIAVSRGIGRIREVGSLGEALADVQPHAPNWVIPDLNLPDGFGWNANRNKLCLCTTVNQ
jgi:DNA-binding NarL/FixJ family response regulator